MLLLLLVCLVLLLLLMLSVETLWMLWNAFSLKIFFLHLPYCLLMIFVIMKTTPTIRKYRLTTLPKWGFKDTVKYLRLPRTWRIHSYNKGGQNTRYTKTRLIVNGQGRRKANYTSPEGHIFLLPRKDFHNGLLSCFLPQKII